MSQNIPNERKKPRPQGAKSGKSREFSKAKLNAKYHLQHKELLLYNKDTTDGNECLEENPSENDFVHNNPGVATYHQERNCPSAKDESYQWIKISCNEHFPEVDRKMFDQEDPVTFMVREELSSTPINSSKDKQQVRQELGATVITSDIDSIKKNCLEQGHKSKVYENRIREKYCSKGYNRSGSCESDLFHNMSSNFMIGSKPRVRHSWQLDQKFAVTKDFPTNIICDDDEINPKESKSKSKTKHLCVNANSNGLPSISTVQQNSENKRFKRELTDKNKSIPVKLEPKFEFSGKTCKAKVPSCFPGILSQPKPNESVQEEAFSPSAKSTISPKLPIRKWDGSEVPEKHSDPLSPVSELPTSLWIPKTPGSTEYTAARVVGELDKAFNETLGVVSEEPGTCITPTSMPTRYSVTPSRRRSETPLLDELASVVSFPHSQSMPNLHEHQATFVPKRVFVTFEEHRPHAKAVDLKAETEIAEKCRNLDLSMDSLGIANLKEKRIRKKTLIKHWMQACGHHTNTRYVSGNRCYACRVHKTGQIDQY